MFIVCCSVACLTACSSGVPESIAYADDAPSVSEPSADSFSRDEQLLIDFHATWLCEVQRRTFTTLDGTEIARSAALAAANVDETRYDGFLSDDLPRQVVRDAVLWAYQQQCRAE